MSLGLCGCFDSVGVACVPGVPGCTAELSQPTPSDLRTARDLATPDLATPDLAAPDLAAPDLAVADLAIPDLAKPDLATPDLARPDLAAPDLAVPDLATPDLATPDLVLADLTPCVCSLPHALTTCTPNICHLDSCLPGFSDCNHDPSDGCELNTGTDYMNCGSCGFNCPTANITGATCLNGACTKSCKQNFDNCDNSYLTNGCNINLLNSVANCGGCGKMCSSTGIGSPSCASGVCNGACFAGAADCNNNKLIDGCEVDILSDPDHCGGCSLPCPNVNVSSRPCMGGMCVKNCAPGYQNCVGSFLTSGCETHTAADVMNCGGCGIVCSSNNIMRSCVGGVCSGSCSPSYGNCDSSKQANGCNVYFLTDPNHCGGCSTVCSGAKPNCNSGVCGP